MHFKEIRAEFQRLRPHMHPLDALNQAVTFATGHTFGGRLEHILTIDANVKTKKGQKKGYLTGVLYLAPHKEIPGLNLCPGAEQAGCPTSCLYTAGRGVYEKTQLARMRKTLLFYLEPKAFYALLKADIQALQAQASLADMHHAIRLNGTSDVLWEHVKDPATQKTILELYPETQFYDYTKLVGRQMPGNYYLTLSYSEATPAFQQRMLNEANHTGQNLAVVFDKQPFPATYLGRRVIDGDVDDLRFLDPQGVVVGLTAKGKARKERTGFVIEHPRAA